MHLLSSQRTEIKIILHYVMNKKCIYSVLTAKCHSFLIFVQFPKLPYLLIFYLIIHLLTVSQCKSFFWCMWQSPPATGVLGSDCYVTLPTALLLMFQHVLQDHFALACLCFLPHFLCKDATTNQEKKLLSFKHIRKSFFLFSMTSKSIIRII